MGKILKNDWADFLEEEFKKDYYLKLRQFLIEEYRQHVVYPDMYDIFNALHYTAYSDTKVVILGQDPYHGPGQAHGLSFSVRTGVNPPPSLQNIFKELRDDLGYSIVNHGYLVDWTKQGVLLLNTVLTVRQGLPNSHRGKGWEIFTDLAIRLLNQRKAGCFYPVGKNAQDKRNLITAPQHFIIESLTPARFQPIGAFLAADPSLKPMVFLEASVAVRLTGR